jgi:hypothetical protein
MWLLRDRLQEKWLRQDGPLCFNWVATDRDATRFPDKDTAERIAKAVEIISATPDEIIRVWQNKP